MTKADIARRIQEQVGVSKQETPELLEGMRELLKSTLQTGEPIAMAGCGTLTVRRQPPRKGWNIRTGAEIILAARRVVPFHPSLPFNASVNAARAEQPEAMTPTE